MSNLFRDLICRKPVHNSHYFVYRFGHLAGSYSRLSMTNLDSNHFGWSLLSHGSDLYRSFLLATNTQQGQSHFHHPEALFWNRSILSPHYSLWSPLIIIILFVHLIVFLYQENYIQLDNHQNLLRMLTYSYISPTFASTNVLAIL